MPWEKPDTGRDVKLEKKDSDVAAAGPKCIVDSSEDSSPTLAQCSLGAVSDGKPVKKVGSQPKTEITTHKARLPSPPALPPQMIRSDEEVAKAIIEDESWDPIPDEYRPRRIGETAPSPGPSPVLDAVAPCVKDDDGWHVEEMDPFNTVINQPDPPAWYVPLLQQFGRFWFIQHGERVVGPLWMPENFYYPYDVDQGHINHSRHPAGVYGRLDVHTSAAQIAAERQRAARRAAISRQLNAQTLSSK